MVELLSWAERERKYAKYAQNGDRKSIIVNRKNINCVNKIYYAHKHIPLLF